MKDCIGTDLYDGDQVIVATSELGSDQIAFGWVIKEMEPWIYVMLETRKGCVCSPRQLLKHFDPREIVKLKQR